MWLKRFKELKEFSAKFGSAVDGIVDVKPHQITLVTQARGRAERKKVTANESYGSVAFRMPCGTGKTLGEWIRKQPKDAKEKRQLREFELFQQFLKWREENE